MLCPLCASCVLLKHVQIRWRAEPPRDVTRASCAQLLRPVPPAVDLLEALGPCVCMRRACCFCYYFAYIALLLLPLSFFLGVGASSLYLAGFMFKAARRGSLSLFVVASAACVYETGLLLLFITYYYCACRTSAASVSLFLGVRRRFPSVA